MKVHVLTDNHAGTNTTAEHGLSYVVEIDNKHILFDAGQSDLFIKNAGRMGIDISNIGLKILSHGHFDHGNGFMHLPGGRLFCHPGCFAKRYRKSNHTYIGLNQTREGFEGKFDVMASHEPVEITNHVIFIGEIPRDTDFESQSSSFIFENGEMDVVMDDSAVAIIQPEGLVVITGCGHAGIVNTLEHAKKITGVNKILGILGGFHLKENNIQTLKTIEYLQMEKIKHIYPSHCTELPAMAAFYDVFHIKQVKTGMTVQFN